MFFDLKNNEVAPYAELQEGSWSCLQRRGLDTLSLGRGKEGIIQYTYETERDGITMLASSRKMRVLRVLFFLTSAPRDDLSIGVGSEEMSIVTFASGGSSKEIWEGEGGAQLARFPLDEQMGGDQVIIFIETKRPAILQWS